MKNSMLLAVAFAATAHQSIAQQSVWGQCGGIGYSGSTTCASGNTCVKLNDYYSQCQPGAAVTSTRSSTTSTRLSTTTTRATTTSSSQASAGTGTPGRSDYTPVTGIYPFGAVKTAVGTTYGGNAWSGGTCSFTGYTPSNIVGVALGKEQWFGGAGCGSCMEITGATGTVTAMVNNQCPECVNNHLDLEEGYAAQVDKDFRTKGIFDISWKFVPCPISGNIQLKNKEGTSAYYFAMQVRNSKLPIDKLEVSNNNGATWTNVKREEYNYFTAYSGFGSVVDIRITASTGAQIVQKGVAVSDGSVVQGSAQFSV